MGEAQKEVCYFVASSVTAFTRKCTFFFSSTAGIANALILCKIFFFIGFQNSFRFAYALSLPYTGATFSFFFLLLFFLSFATAIRTVI